VIDVSIEQTLGRFHLDASFRADGRIVGLFGRSGSGKSSIVNAMAGISRPARGRIVINDGRVSPDDPMVWIVRRATLQRCVTS